jgi:3-oxoacyl-[acyl-carrier protein] reductase
LQKSADYSGYNHRPGKAPDTGEALHALDFSGRVAIVTGGAQGIGFAIARRLRDSGARVRLWDRDRAALARALEALGCDASGLALDVTDAAAVEGAAQEAVADFGRVDVLVNNAGIAGPTRPLAEYPLEEWRRVLDVNLTGAFLCCRAVVPHMLRAGYGRIVNIASIAGKEGNPNAAAYSASKAGLIALTKSLGKELARTGVLVNCVTPAAAKTAIFDQMSQEHIEYMLSKIPMGRFATVEEIAALACWLASQECSFSTGAVFDLSGGRATY